MDYIDKKYINLLSPRLRNFKWKSPTLANFSCPVCGDSEKKKNKARGYLFSHKGNVVYKCHNCGFSHVLPAFLAKLDATLHKEYCLEKFKQHGPQQKKKDPYAGVEPVLLAKPKVLTKNMVKLTALPTTHVCKQYVTSRKIPKKYHKVLYYTENFRDWAMEFRPDKAKAMNEEARLLIPFFDESGKNVIGVQGRSLSPNSVLRYVSVRLDPSRPLMYGLERLNKLKPSFCVEGPLDSLFLPNCIAMATAGKSLKFMPSKNTTIIYDNEPRNKEIVKYMHKAIKNDFPVVFWPHSIEAKDINQMIIEGMSEENLLHIVRLNTYRGLRAELELSKWRRC